ECNALPRLTKGISRALEHSGKCARATDRISSKGRHVCEGRPPDQRLISVQCGVNSIQLLSGLTINFLLL
ncbi:unnamed protein product, partial [Hymenolepis diminuta]